MKPIVISFYTIGTPYEKAAKNLEDSCKRFGISYHIEGIRSFGSWEQNCAFKPAFISQMLHKEKRPIVWVDADACFKAEPKWEAFFDCDIALRKNPHFHPRHTGYVMSGTLFINPTPDSFQLMEAWQEACAKNILSWDQVVLARLLEQLNHLRILPLPFSYVKTTHWDSGFISEKETIIEHGQATRDSPPPSSIDAQKQEFQSKRKAAAWEGIVDYHPSMLRQAVDSCLSIAPFVCGLTVVMHQAARYSKEERRQFAFLARFLPFARFLEIETSCEDLHALFPHTIAIDADQLLDADKMTNSIMNGDSDLHIIPWTLEHSEVNPLLHPYFSTQFDHPPANMRCIDDNQLDQLRVARHLGICI